MKLFACTGIGVAVVSLVTAQDVHKGHAPAAGGDVAKVFAQRCASCHLPPDPDFEVDRAWITQLADTA